MDYVSLSQALLFRGIQAGDVRIIVKNLPCKIRKFRAGSMIAQSGETVTSLMIVVNGIAKGEMVDYAGRVIKIEDIPAPGALASAFLFGNVNRFPVNVIALSDCEILIIEKADFLALMKRNDIILVNFLNMISNRSQFLSEKIKFLNFKTIKGKLAHFILQKSGTDGTSVTLELTQNDLADFFGVTRPSVARAIGDMEAEGLIEAKGKKIRILDRERMAGLTLD
ncbi:MAG TPA: Crp/Fnr family transcriptional regulator [Bacteroidales bacterium]|nr:Crp/Fnr family transcriptional regulator [Bacteroidales bacterium]